MITALRIWLRLVRQQHSQRLSTSLAVVAFATATGALLVVVGGWQAFEARSQDPALADQSTAGMYVLMARTAAILLLVPVLTLGGAAARLAVSRRNQRLATLRLAGATTAQVGVIAIADAALQAVLGVVAGIGLYALAIPCVALLRFQGRPFAWSELWVGWPVLALCTVGLVVLALVSAAFALGGVAVSPLGVVTRRTPRPLSVLRFVLAAGALITWLALSQMAGQVGLVVLLIMLGVCMGVLSLVGPFVLGLVGRLSAARARTVPQLLAARRLVDDPRGAWRLVGGIAFATFIAGVLSVAPALAGATAAQGDAAAAQLGLDMETGAITTLVIAGLVAAVSCGVTQTARLLDHAELYRSLHLAGTDPAVLQAARLREVRLPLVTAVIIAGVTALLIVAPFTGQMIMLRPLGLLIFVGSVVLAVALVLAPIALTRGLVRTVAALPGERAAVREQEPAPAA